MHARRSDGEPPSRTPPSSRPPARPSSRPPSSALRAPPQLTSEDEVGQRLEQLAALGARVAEVAHELRNSLAVLDSSLHLAKRAARGSAVEERLTAHFARMAEQIHAGQAIVLEALDQVRVGPIERESVELRAFLLEVASGVSRPDIVSVDVQAPSAKVEVDARQLRQVLLNLLRNAVEALSEPPGGHVVLSAEVSAGTLRIEVADDGPGIDPALLGRLFQPFASGRRGGTGLGLAVCRRIAESHGGVIRARRREPRGTAMTVELPLSG